MTRDPSSCFSLDNVTRRERVVSAQPKRHCGLADAEVVGHFLLRGKRFAEGVKSRNRAVRGVGWLALGHEFANMSKLIERQQEIRAEAKAAQI